MKHSKTEGVEFGSYGGVTHMELTICLEGVWYVIPFFVLEDMAYEMCRLEDYPPEYPDTPSCRLQAWIKNYPRDIDQFKSFMKPYYSQFKAYQLWD